MSNNGFGDAKNRGSKGRRASTIDKFSEWQRCCLLDTRNSEAGMPLWWGDGSAKASGFRAEIEGAFKIKVLGAVLE